MLLFNKIKLILGIFIVFVLIISTNLIDKKNFERINNTVVTMYEDRIIASDLIMEMLVSIQEKELALANADSTFFLEQNQLVNEEIKAHIIDFEQTKLTSEESNIFERLKSNLEELFIQEDHVNLLNFNKNEELLNHISNIKGDLYALSKIQLDEGKRQMSVSMGALETVELFTQIEIFILVLLAILLQIIVIYKPKVVKN
jgi:hypothetical protein